MIAAALGSLLAQASDWQAPEIDWHAIAPELVLIVGINIVLGLDLFLDASKKWMMALISGWDERICRQTSRSVRSRKPKRGMTLSGTTLRGSII